MMRGIKQNVHELNYPKTKLITDNIHKISLDIYIYMENETTYNLNESI